MLVFVLQAAADSTQHMAQLVFRWFLIQSCLNWDWSVFFLWKKTQFAVRIISILLF